MQTVATLELDVTCCVRLHTLLHVVGSCCAKFETGQTFQPTTPNISFVPWSPKCSATMLDPFAQLLQHWWVYATGRQKEEDGKTFVCDKRDRAITCMFCRDRHVTLMISGLLQKDLFKRRWSLAERFFKQYRDVTFVNTRFAVFVPLPLCCVSSPLLGPRTLITHGLLGNSRVTLLQKHQHTIYWLSKSEFTG